MKSWAGMTGGGGGQADFPYDKNPFVRGNKYGSPRGAASPVLCSKVCSLCCVWAESSTGFSQLAPGVPSAHTPRKEGPASDLKEPKRACSAAERLPGPVAPCPVSSEPMVWIN